jgi:hypothetical protein
VVKQIVIFLMLCIVTAHSVSAEDKSRWWGKKEENRWWTRKVEVIFIDCSVLSIDETVYPTSGWKSSQTRPLDPLFNEGLCKAIADDIEANRETLGLPDSTQIVLSIGLNQVGISKYKTQDEIDRLTDAALQRKNARTLAYLAQQQAFFDDLSSIPRLVSPKTYEQFDSYSKWQTGETESWETDISSHITISVEGYGVERKQEIKKSVDRVGRVKVVFRAKNFYSLNAGGQTSYPEDMAGLSWEIRKKVYQTLLKGPNVRHLQPEQLEKLESL